MAFETLCEHMEPLAGTCIKCLKQSNQELRQMHSDAHGRAIKAETRVADLEGQVHSVGLLITQAAILLNDGAALLESRDTEPSVSVAHAMRSHSERLRVSLTDQRGEAG